MAAFGDINRWELTGRMARDAEVQESNGRKRLRLRVAVHEAGAGEEQARDFKKGRVVRLSGRVTAWKDQEGKERVGLVATDLVGVG
jgi:hypothetical protein